MATAIFIIIIVASLILAAMAARGRDVLNLEEYIVGGRSFSGFLLFFLAVGEIYSIGTMVGLPGGIYAKGASYGIWFLGYILLSYSVGYFMAPLIWRAGKHYGALTLPDIFKIHYSSRALEVVAALTTFAFLIPWAELQFTGLQVALGALGFNLSRTTATVITALIACAYIILSGVRSPALISIMKDILLFVAIVIVGVLAAIAVGSVQKVFVSAQHISPSSLSMGGGEPLTFALTTIVFQAFGFMALTSQYIFTGRSERTVRRTYILMPLYMLMYPFLIIAAYYAISEAPNLEHANTALFAAAVELLPTWLTGLVAGAAALSGLLILATLSLQLGSTLSRNITPNLHATAQRRLTQVTLVFYLALTATLTILWPTLMLDLISVAYYFVTQMLVALFGVLFIWWFSALGLTLGMIVGNVVVVILYALNVDTLGINPGLVALGVNLLVATGVSLVIKNKSSHLPIARLGEASKPSTKNSHRNVDQSLT